GRAKGAKRIEALRSLVMAGHVPAIPIRWAQPCLPDRDRRDRPGDDGCEVPRKLRNLALGLPHHLDEAPEEIMTVARAWRSFRMVLHREHRPVLKRDAAIRAVE